MTQLLLEHITSATYVHIWPSRDCGMSDSPTRYYVLGHSSSDSTLSLCNLAIFDGAMIAYRMHVNSVHGVLNFGPAVAAPAGPLPIYGPELKYTTMMTVKCNISNFGFAATFL